MALEDEVLKLLVLQGDESGNYTDGTRGGRSSAKLIFCN
jgi:hypothetical protein